MMKKVFTGAIVAAFALGGSALSQSTKRIDKRQENQAARIEAGEATGQLTPKEAARLEKGQEHIQKMEDRALADGKITKQEKVKIEHAQNRESRHIAHERHDKQKVSDIK